MTNVLMIGTHSQPYNLITQRPGDEGVMLGPIA